MEALYVCPGIKKSTFALSIVWLYVLNEETTRLGGFFFNDYLERKYLLCVTL